MFKLSKLFYYQKYDVLFIYMANNSNLEKRLKIITEYNVRADLIIRKMFNILTNAHKKVDEAEYKKWINTLNNKI